VRVLDKVVVQVWRDRFVINATAPQYCRFPQLRTRLFYMADAQHILNVIVTQDTLKRMVNAIRDARQVVIVGGKFRLDMTACFD